jgi:hypothetical protein
MSTKVIRHAILDKLSSLEDIGKTHNRQSDFNDMYLEGQKLKGWTISRVSTREKPFDTHTNIATHTWKIRGYLALEDEIESELIFDDLIELIRDEFRSDDTLGNVVSSTYVGEQAALQLDDVGPATFAGVLCHAATMTLFTEVEVDRYPQTTSELHDFETAHMDYDLPEPDGNPETSDTLTLEIS